MQSRNLELKTWTIVNVDLAEHKQALEGRASTAPFSTNQSGQLEELLPSNDMYGTRPPPSRYLMVTRMDTVLPTTAPS